VDFLQEINNPVYKIASFDSVNTKLLNKVSSTNMPVIMSTGMTSLDELGAAWKALGGKDDGTGCDLALLHCVSSYPLEDKRANLSIIHYLHSVHDGPVGYSDHTIGTEIPIYGVAAGASIIEKHFTLDSASEGPDHAMSADPQTLKDLVQKVRWIEEVLGKKDMRIRDVEEGSTAYRRSS
jgi:sialic acid synthase SpsE